MATCPRNNRPNRKCLPRRLLTAPSFDDSGPGTDTCFDVLALRLLLFRSLSVDVHAKHLPLMSTHRLLVTWYL